MRKKGILQIKLTTVRFDTVLNGLQRGLAHLCKREQNIFPVESICKNGSERIGEKWYKGETERRVAQIRREKEPEYQKDGRKKRIKISRDKGYAKGG